MAQCISYEVTLTTLLLCFCLSHSFLLTMPNLFCFLLFCSHLLFILFITVLAETNRSPFDFAEGESELVSGYNVEYSGPGFVVLFLAEYLSILFVSSLVSSLGCSVSYLATLLLTLFFSFAFIWTRASLPRFRYDQLISLSWKCLLPITLSSITLLLLCYYPHFALKACFSSDNASFCFFVFFLL